jgi:hypothetical protein
LGYINRAVLEIVPDGRSATDANRLVVSNQVPILAMTVIHILIDLCKDFPRFAA